jgi:hypothetical protein
MELKKNQIIALVILFVLFLICLYFLREKATTIVRAGM